MCDGKMARSMSVFESNIGLRQVKTLACRSKGSVHGRSSLFMEGKVHMGSMCTGSLEKVNDSLLLSMTLGGLGYSETPAPL